MATRGQSASCTEVGDLVVLPAGRYRLGEPGEEREVELAAVLIGRFPVTNAQLAAFAPGTGPLRDAGLGARLAAPHLADHPATGVAYDEAVAFCAWASARSGRRVRLPTGAEWEAAARGDDGRPWPWGDVVRPRALRLRRGQRLDDRPRGRAPGAAPRPAAREQLAGNVWEWVGDPPDEDGWRARARRLPPRPRLGRARQPQPARRPAARHRTPPASASPSTWTLPPDEEVP